IVASILSFLKTEFERRQVKDAFGLYISPDFMKELTLNPDKLKLGGEIRDLTVMFTDIRSFTSISEGLSPQELIQLMNDFLTPMSDLVMQNRGTIDKYMGDAMMAFWNAPLDDKDHAKNACITALGMQAALDPINDSVAQRAKSIGKEPVLLQAGIGINSGPCAVGNMGSKQRFAYSTLGDAVNLSSRLEGQTKNYGVGILIGEETYNAVTDFACLEIDLIQVKGKQEAVRIFALLGDQKDAQNDLFKTLKAEHENMIASYRNGEFKSALKSAQKCINNQTLNLEKLYDLYIQRCEEMIKNPPEKWNGVYIAKTK
ncbi:MAG: adenylate/guanylate cyclase domain-containing protein, partial [Bdellovibrionales bacterium]